jgi:hypothetical protein
MQSILSILAVLGLGSIIAAFISKRVAISNNRQAWINALREDIATFLRELEKMHYAIGDLFERSDAEAEQKKREARIDILFIYWRIVMRLNQIETAHNDLRTKLDDLMTVREKVPDRTKVEETLELARQIFKQEWDVTKYGAFTGPVLCLKKRLKPLKNWLNKCLPSAN